jgi:hypothetical protein
MVYGLMSLISGATKAASLARFSDHTSSPVHIIFFAACTWLMGSGVVWAFLYSLVVPFLIGMPNHRAFEAKLKRAFMGCGLLSSFWPVTVLLQLLGTENKTQMQISVSFFVGMGSLGTLVMLALGICGWEVHPASFANHL